MAKAEIKEIVKRIIVGRFYEDDSVVAISDDDEIKEINLLKLLEGFDGGEIKIEISLNNDIDCLLED